MEKKLFTTEELDSIKKIQEKYNVLGVQLVQIKLALKNATNYLETIKEQEQLLVDQISEVNAEEKKLAEELDTKYGAGSLDLQTGEFSPKTT